MAINKLVLERDGLVVGNTQLVASGEGISVGSLSVTGQSSFTGSVVFSGNVSISNTTGSNFYIPGTLVQTNTFYTATAFSYSIPNTPTTFTDVPGFTLSITPRSTRSLIYIVTRVFGEFNPASANWSTTFSIKRNAVAVNLPIQTGSHQIGHSMATTTHASASADADSTPEILFFDFIDYPATTSTITYNLCASSSDTTTHFVNRCVGAGTTAGFERGTSSMILFEIAQ